MRENKVESFTPKKKNEQRGDSDVANIHLFSISFSNYAVQGQGELEPITGNTEQDLNKNTVYRSTSNDT